MEATSHYSHILQLRQEEAYFKQSLDDLQQSLGTRPKTWTCPHLSTDLIMLRRACGAATEAYSRIFCY